MPHQQQQKSEDPRREALIKLLYGHIATDKELERMKEVRAAGGKTRTLRAQRGKTVNVHEMADDLIKFFRDAPTGAGGESATL